MSGPAVNLAKSVTAVTTETFNSWRAFPAAIWLPLGVVKHPRLSWGAKVLYGRLCVYAGKEGVAYARRKQMATDMGVKNIVTIGRLLEELVAEGLIRRTRRGPSRPSACEFLRHPCLDRADVHHQQDVLIVQDCTIKTVPDDANVHHQDTAESAELHHPIKVLKNHPEETTLPKGRKFSPRRFPKSPRRSIPATQPQNVSSIWRSCS